MKRISFIVLLIVSLYSLLPAQIFTDSNLPIIIINTDNGAEIKDDPRVFANLKVIYRGPGVRNYVTDQNNPSFLDYNGRIDIEIRGSSSQYTEKKQYAFTTLKADNVTNNNVKLVGLPEENDWILNGMVFDPALIRDYLSYNLSRHIGEYASRTVYCEVIINGNYRGLYVLQEKIKADDNRVNITKIDVTDNSYPEVTGGYITKSDKTTGGDPVAWEMFSWFGSSVDFIHELPKPENVTTPQNDYIRSQFQLLQTTSIAGDISPVSGFPSVIDIPSFINFIILNELASNADGYMYSTFFHKDRNGKLRAGPIWDFDLTYGNDLFLWGLNRSKTNVWQLSNGENDGARFWKELFNNQVFRCYLAKRWNELIKPGQPLNQAVIESFVDQTVLTIAEAAGRNNTRWGNNVDFTRQITDLKNFLSLRIAWITSNIGSFSACENAAVPPLVITKINYHPESSFEFPDSEDLEFMEITNNGNQTVDLTGIGFSGTGLVFHFPPNSVVGPQQAIVLSGNPAVFNSKYGFTPFARYSRSLSNKGENIVLTDAFGNVIDQVNYSDTIPWPEADGNGYYLKLKDPDLDNNNPANWIATRETLTYEKEMTADHGPEIFPNPVTDILRIRNNSVITSMMLYDIYGRLMMTSEINSDVCDLDISWFSPGIYILRMTTLSGTFTEKFIKR
ncbi:MAG: T9SS type A sorting domain-containing protein [Bacteroidales bacterium]|nr:T9SS type A sorting domain-containing protein [Bacteroidales bacterium]